MDKVMVDRVTKSILAVKDTFEENIKSDYKKSELDGTKTFNITGKANFKKMVTAILEAKEDDEIYYLACKDVALFRIIRDPEHWEGGTWVDYVAHYKDIPDPFWRAQNTVESAVELVELLEKFDATRTKKAR